MGKLGAQLKTLFVGDIGTSVKESELRRLFATCGTVQHVHIQRHALTNVSLGHAFVRMSNNDEAIAAKIALDGTIVGGRRIRVKEAMHGQTGATRAIFDQYGVHFSFHALHHHSETNEEVVRVLFERYGPVRDVSIRRVFRDKVRLLLLTTTHSPEHSATCRSPSCSKDMGF